MNTEFTTRTSDASGHLTLAVRPQSQRRRGWRILMLSMVALALVGWFSPARAADPKPDCHVLAVGVDLYTKESKLPNLAGCKNDAINLRARFSEQSGRMFGKVNPLELLVNEQATGQAIQAGMNRLLQQGKAGDWYVLVLSGHGGIKNGRWSFAPHDGQGVSDTALLHWANTLAAQGKKAVIIVDACQAGQLANNAREVLQRHTDSKGGGIVLLLASVPSQCGLALGQYSSYAQAVNEALNGDADLDGNGVVTLRELRHYTYHRVYEICRQFGETPHDCVCAASLSVEDSQPMAAAQRKTILGVSAALTKENAKDKVRTDCHHQVFTVKLQAGVTYVIDLKSGDFDGFLRLEDAQGKELVSKDDIQGMLPNGGVNRNARIVFKPTAAGTFRIVATTCQGNFTGNFTLRVQEGS